MNRYIKQIYRERCEAAEKAADCVQKQHKSIVDKMHNMSKNGVFYTRAERQADSDSLQEANKLFMNILESVFELEDAERTAEYPDSTSDDLDARYAAVMADPKT